MSKILKFPKDKRVYVIGQKGLEEELDAVGIAHAGGSVCQAITLRQCDI